MVKKNNNKYIYNNKTYNRQELESLANSQNKIIIDPSKGDNFLKQIERIEARFKTAQNQKYVNNNKARKQEEAFYKANHEKLTDSQNNTTASLLNYKNAEEVLNYNNEISGLGELIQNNLPTRIPYLGTLFGKFLIAPSVVNYTTLSKIAKHEVVADCLEKKAIKVINSFGDVIHPDKKCQEILRMAYSKLDGGRGLKGLVLKMLSAKIYGSSVNYMKPKSDGHFWYIDNVLDLPIETVIYSATADGGLDYAWQYVYNGQFINSANMYSTGTGWYGNMMYQQGDSIYNVLAGLDAYASFGDLDYAQRQIIVNTLGLVRLDKEYTIHYVSDPVISRWNPYGNLPDTRKVYELCMLYNLVKELSVGFLTFRAMPLIVGWAGSRETVEEKNKDGEIIGIQAVDHLYNQLSNLNANGFVILAGKKGEHFEIEPVKIEGDAKIYIDSLEFYKKQIINSLGSFSSEESSYASATQQNSVWSMLGEYQANDIADVIKTTFNKWILHNNIGTHITDFGGFAEQFRNIEDQMKKVKVFEGSRAFDPVNNYTDYCLERKQLCYPDQTKKEWEDWRKTMMEAKLNGLDDKQHTKNTNKDNINKTDINEQSAHYKHKGIDDDI